MISFNNRSASGQVSDKRDLSGNDFSKESVVQNIIKLAIPMTMAQLINVLYSIVDRIYIGLIPDHATLSLTGIGLACPLCRW